MPVRRMTSPYPVARRRAGARIAVTGATSSSGAARSFLRAELDGVRFVSLESGDAASTAAALRDTDMLVFVVASGEDVEAHRTAELAEAARDRGVLVAALVVANRRATGPSPLLAALREAADMVVVVRDPEAVHAVVAALR
jgi:DNA-binding MurR/RpiR family transcriptional regulator